MTDRKFWACMFVAVFSVVAGGSVGAMIGYSKGMDESERVQHIQDLERIACWKQNPTEAACQTIWHLIGDKPSREYVWR
jgi:hypothetical protein